MHECDNGAAYCQNRKALLVGDRVVLRKYISGCIEEALFVMSQEQSKSMKVIAEIVIFPIGLGTSLSKYVRECVQVINSFPGIRVMHTPMSSIVEADNIDQILAVTKAAHERLFEIGAQRVSTTIRIDDRRDKPRRMEDKVDAVL